MPTSTRRVELNVYVCMCSFVGQLMMCGIFVEVFNVCFIVSDDTDTYHVQGWRVTYDKSTSTGFEPVRVSTLDF